MNGSKPNVIVFLTDQQRWDTAGVHGNEAGLTPIFDRMARRGTHLANTFTCQPVCGPARSCLQTGLYATQTGCFTNRIPLQTDRRTLAHEFRDAGYRTGYIGKWHLGAKRMESLGVVFEEERGGYEDWLASNNLEYTSESYRTTLFNERNEPIELYGYRADAITDAAISYMQKHRDKPFFLFVSLLEPHPQNERDDYPAPDGYEERYRFSWMPPDLRGLEGSAYRHLPGYYGMVKKVDEAFGRLLDALKSLKLTERTIVLYTSDHGCHFRTRNCSDKKSCHESSIRVPAALYGPGFEGGGEIRKLVSLIDLPATLLDASGIAVPPHMQGHSVLPLVNRQSVDWPEEVFVQISESQVARAVRTQRWKYGVHAPDKDGNRDSASDRYEEQYLYDLESDPYELFNLIGHASHAAVCERMKQRLLLKMEEAGEAVPDIVPAPKRPAGLKVLPHESEL